MAPVPGEGASISSTASIYSSAHSLQVILGITLPLVAVASSIPIIMIRRHLAAKSIISQRSSIAAQSTATTNTTCRAQTTPRLPLTSVYIARVDYFLPPSDTGVSETVAESQLECVARDDDSLSSPMDEIKNYSSEVDLGVPSSGLGLMPEVPPLASLPSLSSMLCEFTAYADAIEPENLAEARRSSTCLLDSVFSSMDVTALSFTELPLSPSLPPIQPAMSALSLDCPGLSREMSQSEEKHVEERSLLAMPISLSKKPSSLFYEEDPTSLEDLDFAVVSLCDTDTDTSTPTAEDDIEEISTSQLVSATTTCSIILDSTSTLASLLAVRLSQFPAVPALPPLSLLSFVAKSIVTRRSQSSIGSTITCSISAPASLNIIDIQLDDTLPQRNPDGRFLMDWPSFSNPGELWDEEDDLLFSVYLPKKRVDLSKPVRHTWTAGVKYSRSEKGDLWDDEDDRRFSFAGEVKPLDIFVSGSMFSLEMSNNRDLADSTLYMSEGSSLADHSREAQATVEDAADRTLCYSETELNFIDPGFAEVGSCFDFGFTSFKERNMKLNPSCEQEELESESELCSSAPSSSCRFAFEDLKDGVNATAIYLSESSRSSLMSLTSVLDSPIRIADPRPSKSNLPLEQVFEVAVVDMELEPDLSYCSRIISVNYSLFQEGETTLF
ncbi:hypothetical protein A7U60_g5538 [Sanghuangporus baumii]|uniref:Uncharacterized protein n=1 Tax=Sanghuangporus baumii TaxID=108892 RepID=A0A9Q5HWN8_SANBA|nr:hypothetical protein A7U60_g5538 [Sanghuangporus baumii]